MCGRGVKKACFVGNFKDRPTVILTEKVVILRDRQL
jgi:hypothetical protein